MVLRFIVLHRVEVLLGTRNLVFSHHHCSDAADPRRQIDFLKRSGAQCYGTASRYIFQESSQGASKKHMRISEFVV